MGKLKRERPEPRTRLIQVRVTTAEAEYLKAEAAGLKIKVADLIREALDEWLQRRKRREGR